MNENDRKFYTIGEVSNLLGISQNTIRYIEKKLSFLKPKKIKGKRYYTQKELKLLRLISHYWKEKGIPLEIIEKLYPEEKLILLIKKELLEILNLLKSR